MILDTNAASAFGNRDQRVRERIASGRGPYLPSVVIGELRFGILAMRDRAARLACLDGMAREWTVLDITAETAIHYAEVRRWLKQAARPIPANDAWIAALARQHSMPILTSDKHLDDIPGVDVIGW